MKYVVAVYRNKAQVEMLLAFGADNDERAHKQAKEMFKESCPVPKGTRLYTLILGVYVEEERRDLAYNDIAKRLFEDEYNLSLCLFV